MELRIAVLKGQILAGHTVKQRAARSNEEHIKGPLWKVVENDQ